MTRNYYVILGVPSDASPEEIRDAYRRLAKASHPDVSGEDSGAHFREVQEAWETLGDTERRRVYDLSLKRAQQPPSRPMESASPSRSYARYPYKTSPPDPYEELLDEPGGMYVSTARGQEVHFGLHMTAAEAATGGEMPLRVPVRVRCPACAGLGSFFPCPACQGNGFRSSWRTVRLEIPGGLRNGSTLEVPLAQLGLAHALLILHVEIDPY